MSPDRLPQLIGRQSIFEEVAWELVWELEWHLEAARNRLAPYDELDLIEHRLEHLRDIARLGL